MFATGSLHLACKASSRLPEGRASRRSPRRTEAAWDDVKMFTTTVAATMAKERPDRYVSTIAKRARGAHIFVDYLRNGRGATAVAAYSTRASPRDRFDTPRLGRTFTGLRSTTSQSGTCYIGFHLSNKILGKASSRFVSDCRNSIIDGSENLLTMSLQADKL